MFQWQKTCRYWTKHVKCVILKVLLCIFYLHTMEMSLLVYASEAGHAGSPSEVASTGKIHRKTEETPREKQGMDQRYVELYLKNRELQNELDFYKKMMALFCEPGESLQNVAGKIKMLEKMYGEQLERENVLKELKKLGQQLKVLVNESKLPEKAKQSFVQRIDSLLQETSQKMSQNTQNDEELQGELKILSVNEELEVAAVNCGSSFGLKPGMFLTSTERGKKVVLQLIECRSKVSAVVIVSGRIKDLYPGMQLKLGK